MKNFRISNHLVIVACLTFYLMSCNSLDKDWKDAQTANSTTAYQNFIKNHSSSDYADRAKSAIDSLEWIAILRTHNVDSLELFIKTNMESKFLKNSKLFIFYLFL